MAKLKLIKIEYHIDENRSNIWTARAVAYSPEEVIKTISKRIGRQIIPTSLGEVGEVDVFSDEAIDMIVNACCSCKKKAEPEKTIEVEKVEAKKESDEEKRKKEAETIRRAKISQSQKDRKERAAQRARENKQLENSTIIT